MASLQVDARSRQPPTWPTGSRPLLLQADALPVGGRSDVGRRLHQQVVHHGDVAEPGRHFFKIDGKRWYYVTGYSPHTAAACCFEGFTRAGAPVILRPAGMLMGTQPLTAQHLAHRCN